MASAEAWAARLAPEPFRDFLPYTSASALAVIHPTQVLRKALGVAQHFSSTVERDRHAKRLNQSLHSAGLADRLSISTESSALSARLAPEELGASERRTIGNSVLALYFHLLTWQGPLFLDLRPRHFSWTAAEARLTFFPSQLWFSPDPEFMRRVGSLYAGFYRNDAAELARGLELYRWQSQPSAGYAERMEDLLRAHFGHGGGSELRFSVAHFRATFDALFKEAARSRAKLHPDLTFLGVGIAGLYVTLEALGVPLNPQRAFEGGCTEPHSR